MQSIPAAFQLATKQWDPQQGSITILLANGTYSTGLPFTFTGGQSGCFLIGLKGNSGQGASVIINGTLAIKDFVAVSFNELTFANGLSGPAISVDQCGIVDIASTVSFGNGGACASMVCLDAENGGQMNISGGGMKVNATSLISVFQARNGGRVNGQSAVITVSASTVISNAFVFCDTNGEVFAPSMTFTGAGAASVTGQRFLNQTGGGIWTGGGGANFFPGNSAGSTTTPGWYG
jgi:hypothetical protein